MKKILILLIGAIYLVAVPNKEYNILYGNMVLGKIADFSTINKGYLIAKPTNSLLKLFVSWEHYIIYEELKKPQLDGNNKYKKDKHLLLGLVRELRNDRPEYKIIEKKKYRLIVTCKNDKCDYKRIDKDDGEVTKGFLTFSNNSLKELYDEDSDLSFKRLD